MMKFEKILQKGKYSLILRKESLDEYAVVHGLDEETGEWNHTIAYWNFGKFSRLYQAEALQKALDCFRAKTKESVIEEVLDSRSISAILLDMAKDMDHFDYSEHEEDAINTLETEIDALKYRCPELFTVLEIIALREE